MQESILQYAEHHESVLLGEQYVMWFLFQGLIIFAVPRYAWRRPRCWARVTERLQRLYDVR